MVNKFIKYYKMFPFSYRVFLIEFQIQPIMINLNSIRNS